MRKWFEICASAKTGAGEVLIYDEIGPSYFGEETVSAKDFDAALKALGDASHITLRVNSPGGAVYDALAIYNTLKAHPARVTARIDGIAASAASLVVMAADEIVMPENSFLLIHEPRMLAWGVATDLLAAAAELGTIARTFVSAYARRSGMKEEDVAALMAEDRLMDAAEATSLGLADRTTEAVRMAANFSLAKLPKAARERIAAAVTAQGGRVDSVERVASAARVIVNPTSKRSPFMATNDTEQIRSEARESEPQAPPASQPATAASAEAIGSPPQGSAPAPAPAAQSDPAMADRLRAEYAEIAAVSAQATRLGVTVDAADAMRKGISAAALRRSVLDELATRAEATSVVAVAPSSSVAAESPIVRRAKERAAAARA